MVNILDTRTERLNVQGIHRQDRSAVSSEAGMSFYWTMGDWAVREE